MECTLSFRNAITERANSKSMLVFAFKMLPSIVSVVREWRKLSYEVLPDLIAGVCEKWQGFVIDLVSTTHCGFKVVGSSSAYTRGCFPYPSMQPVVLQIFYVTFLKKDAACHLFTLFRCSTNRSDVDFAASNFCETVRDSQYEVTTGWYCTSFALDCIVWLGKTFTRSVVAGIRYVFATVHVWWSCFSVRSCRNQIAHSSLFSHV